MRDVNRPPTPEPPDERGEKLTLEEKIRNQLHATGERERLKSLLEAKLKASGWKDEIKERCQEFVAKKGRDVSVDEIVKAVRPQGRASVPDSVKARAG